MINYSQIFSITTVSSFVFVLTNQVMQIFSVIIFSLSVIQIHLYAIITQNDKEKRACRVNAPGKSVKFNLLCMPCVNINIWEIFKWTITFQGLMWSEPKKTEWICVGRANGVSERSILCGSISYHLKILTARDRKILLCVLKKGKSSGTWHKGRKMRIFVNVFSM